MVKNLTTKFIGGKIMKNIICKEMPLIKIYCETKNRNPYYIISSFFEFVGVYVYTELIENQGDSVPNEESIPTLYISSYTPYIKDEKICYINTSTEPWNNVTLGNCCLDVLGGVTEEGKSIVFLPVIKYLKSIMNEFPEEIYNKLWNVFIESNLAKPLQNLLFFAGNKKIFSDINECSENLLSIGLENLQSCGLSDSSLENSFQFKYAEFYLKYKIDLACTYQYPVKDIKSEKNDFARLEYYRHSDRGMINRKDFVYAIGVIYNQVKEELFIIDRKNPNVDVLISNIARITCDYDSVKEYILSCKKVIKRFSNILDVNSRIYKSICSNMYLKMYKKAKISIIECPEIEEHLLTYLKLSYINDKNYLNTYAIALTRFLKRKEDKRFVFERCKECMSIYLKGDINPREMKYYLSILQNLCIIENSLEDYKKSIIYGLQAIQFFEDIICNIDYYVKIYGELDAQIIRNIFINNGIGSKMYFALAESYNKIGDKDKFKYYYGIGDKIYWEETEETRDYVALINKFFPEK